jgi:hypothetical protein
MERSFFKSRTWITVMFIFGIALLVSGLAELVLMPAEARGNTALSFVTFGFIMVFLAGLRLYRGEHSYLQDERPRRIGAYGLSWSWFLTFIALFMFFLAGLPENLFPGRRNTFCRAHPGDGYFGQGLPDLPVPEGGCRVNSTGRGP